MNAPDAPVAGQPVTLAPGLRRILAPNPSALTQNGTNTYILGEGEVAVIDPGPAHQGHLEAILAALAPGERISHIVVTHAHLDHSPLARPLADRTGAPVFGFGDAAAGRSPALDAFAGRLGGGEGVDAGFLPDVATPDGAEIAGNGWTLGVLHTPGHYGNHICLDWAGTGIVLCGDHVMGWATTLVSPPDGDMAAYMASLQRLAGLGAMRLMPGHGAPVEDPAARIGELVAHRRGREAEILAALAAGPATAAELTARIYTDLPPGLLPAAERNVISHLIDLMSKNIVAASPWPDLTARFTRL